MSAAFNFRALGKINGFREVVLQLPMPVVNRHAEDGLLLAVGKYQSVLKRFPARVHVLASAAATRLSLVCVS